MKARWMPGVIGTSVALLASAAIVCAQYKPPTRTNQQPPNLQQPSQPAANALAAPRKAVQDAQAIVNDEKAKIAQIRARVSSTFESKDDWIAAKKALADAQAHYDAALKPVVAALQANPEYQKLITNRKAAQEKLDAIKSQSRASDTDGQKAQDDELGQAAGEVLNDGYAINKMEADAKESDGNLSSAKEELAEAKKAMDALQTQVTAALQLDPEYIAEQQNLTNAQQQLTAAKASLAAAEKPQRTTPTPQRSKSSTPGRGS